MQPSYADVAQGINQDTPGVQAFVPQKPQNMHERLMQRFAANQFVRVINIDTQPFEWDYMPVSKEYVTHPQGESQQVYRGAPDHYRLESGESKVLEGANAYLMIEGLFKQILQNQPRGVLSISDGSLQEKYIDQIFQGTVDPFTVLNAETKPTSNSQSNADSVTNQIADDLGLNDESDTNQQSRRTKQQRAN